MTKGYDICRCSRNTFSILILAALPFAISSCGELDLTPKIRDHYMGQEFFEDELFKKRPKRDPNGDVLIIEEDLPINPLDDH
tara:strand:- start:1238 stop:1483 length:246 start_codon:yes stop_codon:yes gene_type:complete